MWIVLALAERGRRLANPRIHVGPEGGIRGDVVVEEVRDADRHRQLRVARVIPQIVSGKTLPELRDAQLVTMKGFMRLSGYEVLTDTSGERAYAQTWHMVPVESQQLLELERAWRRLQEVCAHHGVPDEQVRRAWIGKRFGEK